MNLSQIADILGDEAQSLLTYKSTAIPKEHLYLPSAEFIDQNFALSNRSPQTLRSLAQLFESGRLAKTGYLSILPIDQGIEHSAGASFASNPMYFDPENIIRLAMEGECNAVATTFGGLALLSRKYAHKLPFIVKINHNELLTYPNKYDQIMFGSVRDAWNLGAVAVGATIYFGSEHAGRQIIEVAKAFEEAHNLGMATILWCYLRNDAFKTGGSDYHVAADLTGQANHLGVTIQADIIKQKLPENNGGFQALNIGSSPYGKLDKRMYSNLTSEHPIDLCRYQVLNCYNGRIGLINSGGASSGESDTKEAIRTAIINKRAGGVGLISGRKAFQRPFNEGVALLQAIQDIYLSKDIDIA